ncbi:MAG: HAMP domain-containing sensor histidine kinase [Bacillota bacterium]|nr:HAMP domain-containing sensor histidine kinase [Bacillota bacterium]
MQSSIRTRFTIGLGVIFLFSLVILNLLTREALRMSTERAIENSSREVIKNTSDYVHYRMVVDNVDMTSEGLKKEAAKIVDYFSINYNYDSEISNMKGQLLEKSGSFPNKALVTKSINRAVSEKAVVEVYYSKDNVYGILSYPLYLNNYYIGIITVSKDYTELFSINSKITGILMVVDIGVFLFIFAVSFLFISRITKPITLLTAEVKKVGEGDYKSSLQVNSKDEIGILSKEFVTMKEKIRQQIDAINQEKNKVLRLEKGRREFFNNVTHELKTPLTAITGYAQMLLDKRVVDDKFKNRAAERIYLEGNRMHKLVLDLISVSKGLSLVEEENVEIDMKNLVSEICGDMEGKADKYSLKIILDLQQGFILGKVNKIRQLVINLIDNAIKYSYNSTQINVKIYSEENMLVLEITNHTEPIPDEIYTRIFEPFIKNPKLHEAESSGLGLYISSEIIKEHNGTISIENGSTVIVKVKIPSLGNNLEIS